MRLRRTLAARFTPPVATVLACVSYLAIVTVAGIALPAVDEVPRTFPADTLWDFRVASVAVQASLWAVLGLIFAAGAQEVMTGERVWSRASRSQRAARTRSL